MLDTNKKRRGMEEEQLHSYKELNKIAETKEQVEETRKPLAGESPELQTKNRKAEKRSDGTTTIDEEKKKVKYRLERYGLALSEVFFEEKFDSLDARAHGRVI